MQPQDIFRQQFDEVTARLGVLAAGLTDVAEVTRESTASYWRLRIEPKTATACPVELILHRNQTFDVQIGSEALEGLSIESLDLFEPLLSAVVSGAVLTRRYASTSTGIDYAAETIIGPRDRAVWQHMSRNRAPTIDLSTCVVSERHYTPYRRV
jgi:hypothetical protein